MDYARLAATAQRLVSANGRALTFVRLEDTPADSDEPWRGADEPRATAEEVSGSGVAVDPGAATKLGIAVADSDFIKRAEQILIVVADSDIENFDEIVDDSVRWRINEVQKLKPSSTTLLFYVSVRR